MGQSPARATVKVMSTTDSRVLLALRPTGLVSQALALGTRTGPTCVGSRAGVAMMNVPPPTIVVPQISAVRVAHSARLATVVLAIVGAWRSRALYEKCLRRNVSGSCGLGRESYCGIGD